MRIKQVSGGAAKPKRSHVRTRAVPKSARTKAKRYVYIVYYHEDYEGGNDLDVFGTQARADAFLKSYIEERVKDMPGELEFHENGTYRKGCTTYGVRKREIK